MARILIVEDNPTMREGLEAMLDRVGHDVTVAPDGSHALSVCREDPVDLVITDFKMEGMTGLELLDALRKQPFPGDPEVMLITAYGTIDIAVDAMKLGAVDFITKPFDSDEFKVKVERALKTREIKKERDAFRAETQYLREEVEHHFGEIVGSSEAMRAIFSSIRKVAETSSSVYVYGESGTGKELVARAIHRESARSDGPFIKVNCSALAEGLLESELFGHEKGAFTGAIKERKGRFELAHNGTLFLDEIADIPPSTQVKLLRVLQEKEIERVGGEETITVDVRIISATNRDLTPLVQSGEFREDLFYRLHIIPIEIPPLRERKEDIPLLVHHFVAAIAAETGKPIEDVDEEAMDLLLRYDWPGNVRELENVLERAIVLCDKRTLGPENFPLDQPLGSSSNAEAAVTAPPIGSVPLDEAMERLEKSMIEKALDRAEGVKTRAAELLGIKTSALYYKLNKYGLDGSE
ncbi:MAG: sigma-54 dependent transcriptional regulator [Gemmatimonadota bacterium]|nr:sigma-54 dependent transcriptional regulator [Gemmatimonadota bacterium]